ncbi:hypothetical protein I7I48_07166 [Histoplasma ohiense]|nr:hypothetical protein I7I48_07166 [Histoplasma ohiense (nom. inval.)]
MSSPPPCQASRSLRPPFVNVSITRTGSSPGWARGILEADVDRRKSARHIPRFARATRLANLILDVNTPFSFCFFVCLSWDVWVIPEKRRGRAEWFWRT